MPVERAARADHLPGVYAKLREKVVRDLERGDLRGRYMTGNPVKRAKLNEQSPMARGLRAELAALDAGEPVVIPAWKLGGNSISEARQIPWIADRLADEIEVRADDTVRPA